MERYNQLLQHSGFTFKQHQYDAVQWCVNHELALTPIQNIRGGIIADEMGLGKTLQMIGTMYVNMLPRTLIVLPPVLIQQWYNEIYKASGHKSLIYHGTNKKHINFNKLIKAPIVLTSYYSLIGDNILLHLIKWNRIIFDEAHHLRNSETRIYEASIRLRSNIIWLISGTPIQNKKSDFHSLCYILGFKPQFYLYQNNINIIVQHFILRRTKKQLGIFMEDIKNQIIQVKWRSILEQKLSETIHSMLPNVSGLCNNLKIYDSSLVALLRSRQSCIMSNLMNKYIMTIIDNGILPKEYVQVLDYSSKLDSAIEVILSRKDNGNGKIIFCHFKKEIDTIEQRLKQGGMNHIIKYDGRTDKKQLKSIGDKADAIILQIQTGCEGLNLQENFSEIYFISPHWNPSVEDQAVARCHRIGQKKQVHVFRFIMSDFGKVGNINTQTAINLESYVCKRQHEKREISREILQ